MCSWSISQICYPIPWLLLLVPSSLRSSLLSSLRSLPCPTHHKLHWWLQPKHTTTSFTWQDMSVPATSGTSVHSGRDKGGERRSDNVAIQHRRDWAFEVSLGSAYHRSFEVSSPSFCFPLIFSSSPPLLLSSSPPPLLLLPSYPPLLLSLLTLYYIIFWFVEDEKTTSTLSATSRRGWARTQQLHFKTNATAAFSEGTGWNEERRNSNLYVTSPPPLFSAPPLFPLPSSTLLFTNKRIG